MILRSKKPHSKAYHKISKTLENENKEPVYYGDTVEPGDADKVLLRWNLEDSQYRVIFGDLNARTVTAEELSELEKQ